MKYAVAAGLAAACLITSGAAQAAGLRECVGQAEGAAGARVSVTFAFDDRAALVERYAIWDPASSDAVDELTRLQTGLPNISLNYEGPTEGGIGAPSSAYIAVMASSLPEGVFRGGSMVMTEQGGRAWSERIVTRAGTDGPRNFGAAFMADAHPESRHNPELVSRLDGLGPVSIQIMAADGRKLGAATYDLSAKAERDQLFRQAWTAASKAAENPRKCEKID